ncbi:pyruvate dehydrogenase E2 component (dihydrolipoamide acetyltransferase) [Saccharothrix tamanrassetensis]|uniref:Dihydrolipoamide acetyltransferase component of pyruvate dehydrogenase complex n=1 Tax=Saccharothrix tamanrassetensis TaxID=1051531 RepID=A0A841CIX9_9PSEU|nr:dihydrolipoamide acetyltransferase family protein [Saccharothrix tamanrassetensis]MBB5956933.1 pyruvate dehydrogenase E2 component (dihydrolipoamide acetyltransferase) [Saccharothrix tamanrassetensis]
MPDFRLPDLGEGLTEGEIVNWLVSVGDHVSVDQPVVEVETAKAVVEVPCPFEGVVSARFGEPGEKLAVGSVLLSVGAPAVGVPSVSVPAARADEPVMSSGSGNVLIGYGTSDSPRRRRANRRGPGRGAASPATPAPAPPAPASAASAPAVPVPVASVPARGNAPAVISPLVRRMARDNGLALDRIAGTGPGGVIRRADVERELAAATATTRTATTRTATTRTAAGSSTTAHPVEPPSAAAAPTAPAASAPASGRRIPLRGLRGAVAQKLATSRREIPEATVWVDVDATDFLAARAAMPSVSLLALLARFTVLGLKKFPELNSRVEGDEIAVLDEVHLGFAAQTDRGLVVPVVRDAHTLTTSALAAAVTDLAAAAREGRIAPASLTGGTFTVNNYGVFGVDGSAAIINHPEAAILGIGRIIDRPWVVDGQLAVRKVTQLTLAFDHRVCDGGTAGGFLRFVADCVESPVTALAEL